MHYLIEEHLTLGKYYLIILTIITTNNTEFVSPPFMDQKLPRYFDNCMVWNVTNGRTKYSLLLRRIFITQQRTTYPLETNPLSYLN